MPSILDHINLFYKLARKEDGLSILKNNIGNYIHFSWSDRFGISYNKDPAPGNPRAAYGFPLTSNLVADIEYGKIPSIHQLAKAPYIYIFSVSGNVLNIDNVNINEIVPKLKDIILSKFGDQLSLPAKLWLKHLLFSSNYSSGNDANDLLSLLDHFIKALQLSKIFNNHASAMNSLLRLLGYDAIETNNYGIDEDFKNEIAVLNPSSINLITKINNPMLSKNEKIEIKERPPFAYEK